MTRGRPRPQETIRRDEAVEGLLVLEFQRCGRGLTRNEIAEELRIDKQAAYLSLRRLSFAGKVWTEVRRDNGEWEWRVS